MSITSRPLCACSPDAVVAALNRAYEGYFVPVNVTVQQYERRFRAEGLDAGESLVYEHDGVPAGVLLVARRGWNSRIAAFGLARPLRGQGHGRVAMVAAVAAARKRGDRRLVLEVIEANAAAIKLYQSVGFSVVRRLVGYRCGRTEPSEAVDAIAEIDPLRAARLIGLFGEADLPWQLQPETLAASVPPVRGFLLRDRAAALIDASAETVRLLGLAVEPGHRRAGLGSCLLRMLRQQYPDRPWAVPAIVPETLGAEFFAACGWEKTPLTQFEMAMEPA